MTMQNDNRMAWIRNIEQLNKSDKDSYFMEYEIASESFISGVLDYDNGKILCAPLLINKDDRGMYHYLLKIQHHKFNDSIELEKASSSGYYFIDGVAGELISLLSVFFQTRFYRIATYHGELDNHGMKVKTEHHILHRRCNKLTHPAIFDDRERNFAIGLPEFLNTITSLNMKYHNSFIIACSHYNKALKEVGIDREMIFIRLVSCIEALLSSYDYRNIDEPSENIKLKALINDLTIDEDLEKLLKEFSKQNRIKQKFTYFIEKYSQQYWQDTDATDSHVKISKDKLPKVLRAIYNARSSYLHAGEPMYLSEPYLQALDWKWDLDPSQGIFIDKRMIPCSKKLPYAYWFENIVRMCLISYLEENTL